MTLSTLEPILIQFCFAIFLVVTLVSWGNLIIYSTPKMRFFSKQAMTVGHVCLTSLLIIRWLVSDHLPLSNLYESSLFLAWSLTLVYLLLERSEGVKQKLHVFEPSDLSGTIGVGALASTLKRFEKNFRGEGSKDWLDAIIAPSVMITYTFTTLGLPKEMQQSTVLVPALQSNWLMMHVSMMIFSYGALLFGSLLAVTLLTCYYDCPSRFFGAQLSKNFMADSNAPFGDYRRSGTVFHNASHLHDERRNGGAQQASSYPRTGSFCFEEASAQSESKAISELLYFDIYRESLVNQIDYWSYRIIGIGFPLLTIGILSGAVWANEAWGAYWSWDPKETWALITWLIFAIYLHIRMTRFAEAASAAFVASLGFCVVWMCYLGVNLLGKGLHSYGWLS